MAIWIKPSGKEIEANDLPETVKACEQLGWKRKEAAKKQESKKAEPKKQEQIELNA